MHIDLTSRQSIQSIQKEFTTQFPFLRIDFYSNTSQVGETKAHERIVPSARTLTPCNSDQKGQCICLTPKTSVAEAEQKIMEVYGLMAQIERKSGTIWLGTRSTDKWTLEKQNEQGQAITQEVENRYGSKNPPN